MKKRFFLIIFLGLGLLLTAQDFSALENHMNKQRWDWHQPRVEVYMKGGDTLRGQPVHFTGTELSILPSRILPVRIGNQLVRISLEDVEGIYINRGGRITLAQTSGILIGIGAGTAVGMTLGGPIVALLAGNALGVGLGLAGTGLHNSMTRDLLFLIPEHPEYPQELEKLRRWSVFPDSLVLARDLRSLPEHSTAIRRAFPQKHFRVSVRANAGFSMLKNTFSQVIHSGALPSPESESYTCIGTSMLDLSWRFRNRIILGGEWMLSRNDMAYAGYYYYDPSDPGNQRNYTYWVGIQELRFYADWVFMPMDRFFTRHHEIVAGAGFIASFPRTSFYSYREISSDPHISESAELGETNKPLGFQLRAAFHYYPFRNVSVSAGLEMSLYQDMKVPDVYYPSDAAAGLPPFLEAHDLNYSSFRFRLGVHMYF